MVLHYGGRYRAAVECKFLEQVEDELTEFWSNCQPNSVLVFPPLTAHYRFLIHQLVGVGSRLQTVSIGQGGQRRTVVYLAEEREQQKMADSPSAAHRTFGRGRGRRSRRPDQALYVPGALRRAKLVQQEQASNTECVIDKENGKEISSVKHNDLTSALPGSAQNTGNNATANYISCKQNSELKTVKSLFNNKTPESTRAVDVPNRTDSASSNAHKQLVDIQSHVCDNQRVIKEYKEASRELITPRKDGNKAVTDHSGMVLEAGVSNALEVRGERNERNKRGSMNDDQKFERESSNNEAACRKNAVEVHNSENPQACMSALGNFNVTENVLGAVNESCGDLKVLKVDDNVTEQTQGVPTSNANHISVIPGEDETVLQIAESKMDDEKGSRLVSGRNSELKAGLAEISANVTNDWKKGEEVVVQGECCTEKEITTVDGEVSRTFGTCSDDTEARKEQGDNKELIHEHALQNASTAGMTIIECTGSNYETEGFLPQPATCNAGKGFLPTHGDLSASEDDVPNQHRNSGGCMVICDLSSCQTRSNEDEMINKTAQVTYMWPCKDTSPNSGSVIERDIPSDITLSTCLIGNGKMESQDNFIGLALNSNKKNEELGSELAKQEEKIQGLPGRNVRSSESVVVEFNQNVDELQTEHSKTSSCKKKKTKKEKSKEGEDKMKSKENGEKKKKKEKKSGKAEKSDKEEILDSEGKIKEKKKSKTKGLIDKELKRKDLSTVEKRFEAAGSAGDNDDDDNWESNFDESGDCLKPEYLEELSRLTGIKNPEVHKTQFDYYSFTPNVVELDDEEFGHIVEIYNISPDMKTQDIMQALSCFRSKGFDIKWVDDTHALGVFSSRISAQEAIQMCSTPLMKLRPVSQGIPESRKKATNCFEFLQPYKERPQTSKLLADRMVTGALGMRSKMTREERVKEREKLKEAKNKKQQEKIQKAQIWGD